MRNTSQTKDYKAGKMLSTLPHKKENPPSNLTGHAGGLQGSVTRGRKNPLWFGAAERLERSRAAAGLTQRALGTLAGCPWALISRYETGTTGRPAIDAIERLACALGLSPCWLAFGWDGTQPFRQKRPQRLRAVNDPKPVAGARPFEALYLGAGRRLEERRGLSALSYRELGDSAGLSHEAVRMIEVSEKVPTLETIERLAVALDVSPCWLAYGIGRPKGW
jgi:transcriptional regulator with XRE-family HTH domain